MRILLLNQPFHPDVVASAQIAKDLADDLVAEGHDVTAVASASLYGQPGTSLPAREHVDGIEVLRVGRNRYGKAHLAGRLWDFAEYYVRSTFEALRGERFDAIVCLTTPPYLILAALLVARLRASRVVYWLMDVYPDVMFAHGMLRPGTGAARVLTRLHRAAIDRSDATVVLGRCMRDRLVAQGASPGRIHVVPVWSAAPEGAPPPRASNPYRMKWGVGDRLLVMYAGNFGLAHDMKTFLEAARMLRGDDRVRFAFVGGGLRKPEVETFVERHALGNCIVEPYQPRERLAELLAAGDVHLVTMDPAMVGLLVPSKFYGVAAAARPCVFIGPTTSEVAHAISEWQCGAIVPPGDAVTLVEHLRTLVEQPDQVARWGANALRGVERSATRAQSTRRLGQLIQGKA
jgi:colanic acid biosynthesis glycosyl transferase WcaI